MSDTIEKVDELSEQMFEETPSGNSHVHIINPQMNKHIGTPGMSSRDIVSLAMKNGLTIYTLCGISFVPVQTGDTLPICEKCMDTANALVKKYG